MAYAEQEHSPCRPTAPPHPSLILDPDVGQRGRENQETSTMFRDFQKLHDKAYTMVQKGLDADEQGDLASAQQYYTCSLPLLEQVLTTDCERWPETTAAEIEAARQMQLKLNKTKLQITYRMETLQQVCDQTSDLPDTNYGGEDGVGVRLPSYEEAMSSGPSSPVSEAGGEITMTTTCDNSLPAGECPSLDGTELFCIADGVQIFHITHEGYVSAPSYPASLHIVRIRDSSESDGGPESGVQSTAHAFLQVGDWLYPLIPGASPVLQTAFGAYLFPDLSDAGTGSSVGMILPETLSEEDQHILEDILRNFSVMIQAQPVQMPQEDHAVPSAPIQDDRMPRTETEAREEESRSASATDQSTSAKISRGILVASTWISWGLGKGAEKAGQWISYGSEKLREQLHPEAQPRPVDPRVQKGVLYARKASNAAVAVSAFVVTKLGEATVALGRRVAPCIRKKGGELLPQSMKTEENKSRLHGVMEVASSGLQGFGTVWLGLEAAAKALGRSVATETVATVNHKYGADAGKLAENTVYTAGNVAMAAYTAESLAIKAIAKRTAKDAGAAVVDDLCKESEDQDANTHRTGASDSDRKEEGREKKEKEGKSEM